MINKPPTPPKTLAEKLAAKRPPAPMGQVISLVDRLARGRDQRRRMTWPGGSLEIELQILTRAETAAAHAAANAVCAARGYDTSSKDPHVVEALVDERVTQILARAVLDAETHEPLATSAEQLAAAATDDELHTLFEAYADLRHEVDPDPEAIPEEVFSALEAALKKKDAARLSSIVSSMPTAWLRTLVLRLGTSPTLSSTSTSDSSGSPSSIGAVRGEES